MNKMSGAEKMALLMCSNFKKYEPIVVCGGESLKKAFDDKGIDTYALRGPFLHEMGVKQQRGYPHLSWTTCRGVDNSAS